MQVPKACCIPICEGLKFNLVHKFPSDTTKYNEWIDILKNSCGLPEKMKDLTQDQVKKRLFICCRHFGTSSYKSKLNLTKLTLITLDYIYKYNFYFRRRIKIVKYYSYTSLESR
jgi:hypothetical protein